jgi:LysM repeat protein
MPKVYYSLTLLILIIALSGCELRRNPEEIADPAPVSDIPPTLAPLGEVEALGAEATAVPTIISVQPTATVSNLGEGQAAPAPAEPSVPTSVAVDLSVSEGDGETPEESSASADSIAPPAEEAATTEEVTVEETVSDEAVVVDATTTDELASGGPVAANPPVSQTGGSYEAPAYPNSGSYVVQPGDTLFSVAQRHGTTVEAIAYTNGLTSDVIYVGQVLNISASDGGNYPMPGNYNQPVYQQPGGPNNGGNYHIVAPGETLYSIALQYNSSIDAIASVNRIDYPFTIKVGQQLMVPTSGNYAGPPQFDGYGPPWGNSPAQDEFYQTIPGNASLHVVAPGETLYAIALQYGTSVDTIAGANGIPYPYNIGVGQQLLIPAPGSYAGSPPPPADGYYQQPYQGYQQAPADNYGAGADTYSPKVDGYGYNTRTHTVAPGETLYSIARIYNASAEALAAANGLSNPNQLFVGQVLYLP